MDLKTRIVKTLEGITKHVAESSYTGNDAEYIVFNYNLIPDDFGDDGPGAYRALIQVHYYAPKQKKSLAVRREISRRIVLAGFTAPEVIDASDLTGQCWLFEFEDVTALEEVFGDGEIEHSGP